VESYSLRLTLLWSNFPNPELASKECIIHTKLCWPIRSIRRLWIWNFTLDKTFVYVSTLSCSLINQLKGKQHVFVQFLDLGNWGRTRQKVSSSFFLQLRSQTLAFSLFTLSHTLRLRSLTLRLYSFSSSCSVWTWRWLLKKQNRKKLSVFGISLK
jgi:hypothetical protein